jgi:hypothetical protein
MNKINDSYSFTRRRFSAAFLMTGKFKLWPALAVCLVLLAVPLRAQFVYVTNQSSGNVSAYSIGPNGALTPVPGSPLGAGSRGLRGGPHGQVRVRGERRLLLPNHRWLQHRA